MRSKANFGILEGFLSELLHDDIKIQSILESESNKSDNFDKANRVDLLVKNQKEELIIIEVQYEREADYMQRILFSTSKVITENIVSGDQYSNVKKVISVSIVYFDLGQGEDYIYKGTTNFVGLHKRDELKLGEDQKRLYKVDAVYKIFPEYYILKINQFNDVAKDGIDQWIYFLKNDRIDRSFNAQGLKEAAVKLDIMKLPLEQRKALERYMDARSYQASMYESTYKLGEATGLEKGKKKGERIGLKKGREEGREKGERIGLKKGKKEGERIGLKKSREEGREEGEQKAKVAIAKKLKSQGIASEIIAQASGLTLKQIDDL